VGQKKTRGKKEKWKKWGIKGNGGCRGGGGEVTTVAEAKNTASSSATDTVVWKELGMNGILSKEEVLQLAERIEVM